MRRVTDVTVVLLAILAGASCTHRAALLAPIEASEVSAPLPVQVGQVNGVNIAWSDTGGDGPPIVFIHGLSSYMGFWERQLPVFQAAGYRVLALDLPGFGASGRPDAPYTPPWYAALIDGWLTQLGVGRATVVGHSMGGQIGIFLALDHPERVSRLVLTSPAGLETFSPGEGRWMQQYWTEGRALEADEDAIRANFHMNFAQWDEGVERLMAERVRAAGSEGFRGTSVAVSRCVAGMIEHPVYARLPEVAVPTLILFGDDDRLIPNPIFHGGSPRAIGEIGAQRIPGARLEMLRGAGHMAQHDRPEAWNALVMDWLKQAAP